MIYLVPKSTNDSRCITYPEPIWSNHRGRWVSAAEYIVELLVLRTLQLHDFQILRKSADVNLGNFWPWKYRFSSSSWFLLGGQMLRRSGSSLIYYLLSHQSVYYLAGDLVSEAADSVWCVLAVRWTTFDSTPNIKHTHTPRQSILMDNPGSCKKGHSNSTCLWPSFQGQSSWQAWQKMSKKLKDSCSGTFIVPVATHFAILLN